MKHIKIKYRRRGKKNAGTKHKAQSTKHKALDEPGKIYILLLLN